MGELRQLHPSLKIFKSQGTGKTELKMKATLGKNVRVSLPKAYQTTQTKKNCLAVKEVPTDITANEFKEFLDLNKITYAKAERLKSRKDGRVLPIFQLEISDPAEVEALLSQNLVCNVTGIVYKWKNFVSPFRSGSASTANVSDIRRKIANQNKNVSSVVRTIRTKDAQKKKQNSPNVQTVLGHMLPLIKGVPNTKSRHSGNMWLTTKNPMPL